MPRAARRPAASSRTCSTQCIEQLFPQLAVFESIEKETEEITLLAKRTMGRERRLGGAADEYGTSPCLGSWRMRRTLLQAKRLAPCSASLTPRVRCLSLLLIGEQPSARLLKTSYASSMYVVFQGTSSLRASGHAAGTVTIPGDGGTHTVPVHFGYEMHHAILRSAGRDLVKDLTKVLTEQGHWERPSFQTVTPSMSAPERLYVMRRSQVARLFFSRGW